MLDLPKRVKNNIQPKGLLRFEFYGKGWITGGKLGGITAISVQFLSGLHRVFHSNDVFFMGGNIMLSENLSMKAQLIAKYYEPRTCTSVDVC